MIRRVRSHLIGRFVTFASAAALLTACAGVPTAGPVQQVSPNVQQPADTGVRIDAEGPRDGASPEIIVAGFLNAMASLAPGFAVARDYLTDSARETWNPSAGVTITDASAQQLTSTGASEVLSAPLVGHIDGQGRHTVASGRLRHDFGLRRVNGQWRISNPPAGLLISSTTFRNYYTSLTRWFVSQDGTTMVPETLEVPVGAATPTRAITALLQGPSSWLAPRVDSAVPAGVHLTMPAVSVSGDGTAEVDLPSSIAALPDAQRQHLALQVAWTLQQFDTINRVRLMAGDQPLSVSGLPGLGTIDLTGNLPGSPIAGGDTRLLAVRQGRLVNIDSDAHVVELTGAMATSGVTRASGFAAGDAGRRVVWADSDGIHSATATGVQLLTPIADAATPQVSADGTVWDLAHAGSHPVLLRIDPRGTVSSVELTGLPAGTVRAFRVSPDGVRVALVVQQGGTSAVGMVAIGQRSRTGGPWYPLTSPTGQLAGVRDVGWSGASQVAVLASSQQGGQPSVFTMSDDGAQMTGVGPVNSYSAQHLAAHPVGDGIDVAVLTADGLLVRCDDPWRWAIAARGVTTLAFSS